ncbi:MAG: alkaline phosphatase [Bacteroidetes bacterium SW_11_45_7]|nr:MAG: alkaline phosphatase [Bacteroidetes bacterium SW_11_45_7]
MPLFMTDQKTFVNDESRRRFLKFLGRGVAVVSAFPLVNTIAGCDQQVDQSGSADQQVPIQGMEPSLADDFLLAEGFAYSLLLKWGDPINEKDTFGFNNDYIAFLPDDKNGDSGLLWVNHEYIDPKFVSGVLSNKEKTKKHVEQEQYEVGGTILKVKRNPSSGHYEVVQNDQHNRRLTAKTEIPIISDRPIRGQTKAIGTLANCAGGVTPRGHILTCEENYQHYYGETDYTATDHDARILSDYDYGWHQHFNYPPEHYGWVVEVNPETGDARKLTALGRFAHESATVRQAKDGRCVVYSGDDANDECLYKFIADEKDSLDKGQLYVAQMEKGKWIALDYNQQPKLQEHFTDQTEVMIRCREAAHLLGATPLARPEDIAIDPENGSVVVALTNNKPKNNYHGELLKIEEQGGDPLALRFQSSTLLAGGAETGFSCPDNLTFDPKGNLWFTTDISGSSIGEEPYEPFKNNGLFLIPTKGPQAGLPVQVVQPRWP